MMIPSKISYKSVDDTNVLVLIKESRKGLSFNTFFELTKNFKLSLQQWASLLHITERTLHRYKKEGRSFDSIHTERIFEIVLLFKKGIYVFGNQQLFFKWLSNKSIALGGVEPKELLDSTFGIGLIKDELYRIEHGVFA